MSNTSNDLIDDEMIPHGGDGIVDFVIGDCTYEPPDIPIDPDDFDPRWNRL